MASNTEPPTEPPHDLNCLSIAELERLAYHRMNKQTREYYNEGADSNSTVRENHSAYAKYRIRPRVLRDISLIDTKKELFGRTVSVPIGVAPTAMQCLAHPDGEIATAKACKKANWPMGLSSFATQTLEDVSTALQDQPSVSTSKDEDNEASPPQVLQLYLFEEKEHSRKLIRRAKNAGYRAVFLTVDTPVLGRRNTEIRNQFQLPKPFRVANFAPEEQAEAQAAAGAAGAHGVAPPVQPSPSKQGYYDGTTRHPPSGQISFHSHAANPTLSWDRDIAWLKRECAPEMQVWLKGVATAEDAELAVQHGLDGLVVSNHGGRQLDGALATLDALPEVVDAVQGKIPVHVDGGIRHGTDAFKALALGADFVWVGRPVLWGLAYKGQEGVELCLRLLSDELRLCMGLAGTLKVDDITKNYLAKVDRSGFVSRL